MKARYLMISRSLWTRSKAISNPDWRSNKAEPVASPGFCLVVCSSARTIYIQNAPCPNRMRRMSLLPVSVRKFSET